MFKFGTLVYLALAVCFSHAQARETEPRLTDHQFNTLRQEIRDNHCDENGPTRNKLACERITRMLGGSAAGKTPAEDCDEAIKEFRTSQDGFSSACQTLGLPNGGPSGSIACSWSKERCNCLNKGFEDTDDRYECASVRSERGSSERSRTGASGLIDINNARLNMKYCPQKDPDDIERYEKQLEKSQERLKELKKKSADLMTKGPEAQEQANKAVNDAHEKAAEKQKEFANELKEIKRKREADEQAAVEQMNQMRQQMDAIDAQVRNLMLAKNDAENKLNETRIQIELQCHAMASKQVADLQAQKMAAIKRGMPMGDFNELMKSVGVSSRQAWENKAAMYYTRCLVSRPTRESKASAQRVYESTKAALDTQIQTERKNRDQIETSINQIVSNGCAAPSAAPGQPAAESRMCKGLRQANEDAINAQMQAARDQQVIQQKLATAQQQLAQKNQTLTKEYADAQAEQNEEQQRMENLRAYLDLKRQFNLGGGTKEAAKELATNSTKLRSSAIRIDQCCADGAISEDRCKLARDYITSFGGNLAERAAGSSPTGSPSGSDRLNARPESTTPRSSPSRQGEGVRESEETPPRY